MKRLFVPALRCATACCLHAQAVDTTVCDILKNPQSFNGKTVRIKGTVAAGFDQFIVKGPDCGQQVDAIWLAYPEGTKSKSGAAAMLQLQPARNFGGTVTAPVRTPVSLDKNKDFKQFDSLLSTPYKGDATCLGCVKYEVNATLVGRLDGTVAGLKRDSAGKIVSISGFGNLNAYSARLVLESVSDVTAQEIDYSKAGALKPAQPNPGLALRLHKRSALQFHCRITPSGPRRHSVRKARTTASTLGACRMKRLTKMNPSLATTRLTGSSTTAGLILNA